MTSYPPKKKPSEISVPPKEFSLSPQEWKEFSEGVSLFNRHQFWHAHEVWENVWKHRTEDERLFFQGLIQFAAAYHHFVTKRSLKGMVRNFEKAFDKLTVFAPRFLDVAVTPLLAAIKNGMAEVHWLGEDFFQHSSPKIIPTLAFHPPATML